MSDSDSSTKASEPVRWRPNWSRAAVELGVIFVGVTAAFFVESYRERLAAEGDLRQASAGILSELRSFESRGGDYVEAFRAPFDRWREADAAGRRAVPEFYRIPGAPTPPTAAWDAAVASGVASQFEPGFRFRLGYFYSEFRGIHVNYVRHLDFIERQVLPRVELGPDAFYDGSGRFDPAVRVRMALIEEYVDDLERFSLSAGELADEIEAMQGR
jgi:hypothetical protein